MEVAFNWYFSGRDIWRYIRNDITLYKTLYRGLTLQRSVNVLILLTPLCYILRIYEVLYNHSSGFCNFLWCLFNASSSQLINTIDSHNYKVHILLAKPNIRVKQKYLILLILIIITRTATSFEDKYSKFFIKRNIRLALQTCSYRLQCTSRFSDILLYLDENSGCFKNCVHRLFSNKWHVIAFIIIDVICFPSNLTNLKAETGLNFEEMKFNLKCQWKLRSRAELQMQFKGELQAHPSYAIYNRLN